MKRFARLFVSVLLCIFALQTTSVQSALKAPLPAPPSQEVINAVIAQTSGAQFTPLHVPSTILDQLDAFGEPFDGITLDTSQAVHYITTKGNLLETLIPVADLGEATLAPKFVTPLKKQKPGMVIGAWFNPELGPRWVVVTFKAKKGPNKVRFYDSNNKFTQVSLLKGTFSDTDGDQVVEPVDEGAVISDKRSCITVGLDQLCWKPQNHSAVRDETKPEKKAKKAEKKFTDLYNISVNFDEKNAVPDLLGKAQREACAAYLSAGSSFSQIDVCKANLIIASATAGDADDPIALLVLSAPADVRTFDIAGNPVVGGLPADKYLVLPTQASSNDPGTPTVLFLVGLNGTNYLIPSTIMQGFGTGVLEDTGQAGIRDGFARYRMFGW